jgi:hypothetical protein
MENETRRNARRELRYVNCRGGRSRRSSEIVKGARCAGRKSSGAALRGSDQSTVTAIAAVRQQWVQQP